VLWRKLWADTRALSRQAVGLVVLVGLGIALFVSLQEAYQNLTVIYGQIYQRGRLADASVHFRTGPASLVYVARTIPHVQAAMGRLVGDGAIIQRGARRERALGRFIGVPRGRRPEINDLLLLEGHYPVNGDEAVVEQQFAHENGLALGGHLKCVYEGREREFTIAGLASSPEYIYPVPSKYETFVSPGTFGVVFVLEERAREWLGRGAQITEIHCRTDPGYEAEVLEKLRGLVRSYGLDFAYVQDEQPSKRLLDMDQQGFAQLSLLFPLLFLAVSAVSLYSALTRITRMQMSVIGTLRASGFSRREILLQYMLQGVLLALAGGLPGAALGHLLAIALNRLYAESLHLPVTSAVIHWDTICLGVVVAALTGAVASYWPARLAADLPPAQALRGEVESRQRVRMQRSMVAWTRFLPVAYRIPARGVFRQVSRALLAVAGIAGGAAVIITTLGMHVSTIDAIDEILAGSRNYQIDLQFSRPAGAAVAQAATRLPGGRQASLTVSLPVRLSSSWASGETILTGLQTGQRLVRVKTVSGEPMVAERGMVWLPKQLVRRLRVDRGDPVLVEWVQSSRRQRVRTVFRVAGALDVAMGNTAYGEYADVRRSLADRVGPQSAYGANFQCDPTMVEAFRNRFERSPGVLVVATTTDVARQIEEAMGTLFVFIGVLLSFGSVLAGFAIHTVASVTLLERTRELASLRTLGFSVRAASVLIGVELLLLAAVGLLVGLPLGAGLNHWFLSAYQTETMSFRVLLPAWVYVVTILIVLVLVGLSASLGARRLRNMDLAQAAKAAE